MQKRVKYKFIRIIALWRVLTSKNFMVIDRIEEIQIEGEDARRSRLLRRTDYTTESDFLTLKMALMRNFDVGKIEEKFKNELEQK